MNKRKQKLSSKIGAFMQQYTRKAQRGQEPNDRAYSRSIEGKLKRMKPEDFDELLNGEQDEPPVPPRRSSAVGYSDARTDYGPLRRTA